MPELYPRPCGFGVKNTTSLSFTGAGFQRRWYSSPRDASAMQRLPLDCFYCSKIEGKPWKIRQKRYWEPLDLPEDQLDRFIEEYAKVQIQLSNIHLPFNKIGCVFPSDTKNREGSPSYTVGPVVARGRFMKPASPYLLGPFATNKERYLAHIDAALYYITMNALQASFECSSISPVDEYLWHLELRELVAKSKQLDQVPDQIFFKHDDEKGDHLMVDDQNNVIGILDWEWAYVTTKAEAFSTPDIFTRRLSYSWGRNTMSLEEEKLITCYERLKRPDLADCVRNGRLYTKILRIGQYDTVYSKRGFRDVFGHDVPVELSHQKPMWTGGCI
ncbi:hypothetical protein IAT40_005759 [Kwoniella sp. CBS 6097]